jgi:hypothetical protein
MTYSHDFDALLYKCLGRGLGYIACDGANPEALGKNCICNYCSND